MKKSDVERCRKILLEQREEILTHARRILSGEVYLDSDDFPDELDSAVSESNLSLAGRLHERERGLLNKIERSLDKIEQDAYGKCENCGEEIGIKRLRARPVADFCIDCKDERERLERQTD